MTVRAPHATKLEKSCNDIELDFTLDFIPSIFKYNYPEWVAESRRHVLIFYIIKAHFSTLYFPLFQTRRTSALFLYTFTFLHFSSILQSGFTNTV